VSLINEPNEWWPARPPIAQRNAGHGEAITRFNANAVDL
jgi:hypothetical protein